MYPWNDSKGEIFPPLANNRVIAGYPVHLLHLEFPHMYRPSKFNTPDRPYSMSAPTTPHVCQSALSKSVSNSINLKRIFFWMPLVSIQPQTISSAAPSVGCISQISKAFQNL